MGKFFAGAALVAVAVALWFAFDPMGGKTPTCSSEKVKEAVIEAAQKSINKKLQGIDVLVGFARLGSAQDKDIKEFLSFFGTDEKTTSFLLDKKFRDKALSKDKWQVKAVRTKSIDEGSRSCQCAAVLEWNAEGMGREFPVSYAAELTDKSGEVYVTLDEFVMN